MKLVGAVCVWWLCVSPVCVRMRVHHGQERVCTDVLCTCEGVVQNTGCEARSTVFSSCFTCELESREARAYVLKDGDNTAPGWDKQGTELRASEGHLTPETGGGRASWRRLYLSTNPEEQDPTGQGQGRKGLPRLTARAGAPRPASRGLVSQGRRGRGGEDSEPGSRVTGT